MLPAAPVEPDRGVAAECFGAAFGNRAAEIVHSKLSMKRFLGIITF